VNLRGREGRARHFGRLRIERMFDSNVCTKLYLIPPTKSRHVRADV